MSIGHSSLTDEQPLEQAAASFLRENPEDTGLLEQYLENALAESKEDLPIEAELPPEAMETAIVAKMLDSILRSIRLEISGVQLRLHSFDYDKSFNIDLLYFTAVPVADTTRKWRFTIHGLNVKYEQSSESSIPSTDSESGEDDLTQSMYFSTEQSRSIYQSAMLEPEPQSFPLFTSLSDIEGDVLLSDLQIDLTLHVGTCQFTFRDAVVKELITLLRFAQPSPPMRSDKAQSARLKLSMSADKIDLRLPQRFDLYLTVSNLSFELHGSEAKAQFTLNGGMQDIKCIQSSIDATYHANKLEIENTGLILHITPNLVSTLSGLKSLFAFSKPSTHGTSEQHNMLQVGFHTNSIDVSYSPSVSVAIQFLITDCSITSETDDLVLISFKTLRSSLNLSSHELDFVFLQSQVDTRITAMIDLSSFNTHLPQPLSSLDRILHIGEYEARRLVNHHFDHVSMKSLYRISSINIPKAKITLSSAHFNALSQLSNSTQPVRTTDQDTSDISASFKVLVSSLDINFDTWHGNTDQLELKGVVGSQNFVSFGIHSMTVNKSRKTVLKRLIDSQHVCLYGMLVKSDRIVTRLHLNELILRYDFSMLTPDVSNSSTSSGGTSSLNLTLDGLLSVHDCAVQLLPLNTTIGAASFISHAGLSGHFVLVPDSGFAKLDVSVSKCYFLVTNKDTEIRSQTSRDILRSFRKAGYALVLAITSEMTTVQLKLEHSRVHSHIHTHDLSVQMESCADSTETFFDIVNSFGPAKEVGPPERKSAPISETQLLHGLEDEIPKYTSPDLSQSVVVELVEKPIDKNFVESYYGGLEGEVEQGKLISARRN